MVKHGGGSVIFTSTVAGYSFAFPGVAAYAASKSGLIGLTQALAAEFGPQGVRVNAVLPAAVETDMYRTFSDTADKRTFITNLHALKRVAKPEEVARTVLYLASDDASFVSGAVAAMLPTAPDPPRQHDGRAGTRQAAHGARGRPRTLTMNLLIGADDRSGLRCATTVKLQTSAA
jgi:NAD(P)-dependent dehydrogenase (short-subunit alcohol dehydrogenase family)